MPASSRSPFFWIALGLAGGAAAAWQATRLKSAGLLDAPPNVAAMVASPYGKTLAIALQGPVDTYWHKGRDHHDHDHEGGHDHEGDHDHAEHAHDGGAPHDHEQAQDHAHVGCDHCEESAPAQSAVPAEAGPLEKMKNHLRELGKAVTAPNTPYGLTPAHEKFIHRQIEYKLELSYWLDPGNFANFQSLMLFLSEDQLASRKVAMDKVFRFCDYTLRHVERNEKANPIPWLTAAAAANAKLEWYDRVRNTYFGARDGFVAALADFERCLNRFEFLKEMQKTSGNWETLPKNRREVIDARSQFLYKILESHQFTLKTKFSQPSPQPQTTSDLNAD